MIDGVDLCMWAKNGARYLPYVLKRIDDVIPARNVNKKILVDDSSTDTTVEIARAFGWEIFRNTEGFISGGTREALKNVESEFFVSVEQDILLARNWWDRIPKYMKDPLVVVAQGIRVPTHPTLRCLAEYSAAKDRRQLGYSIDNNIFRTSLLRMLGGFPGKCQIYVDNELLKLVNRTKYYKWIVDEHVVSYHIRESILRTASQGYKQAMLAENERFSGVSLLPLLRSVATSPARGLQIALKKRHPEISMVYPFLRLMALRTFLRRPRKMFQDSIVC
jgi:glycosyltransferase involved in cell wall biosynthesis